jgi:hypothetical protein
MTYGHLCRAWSLLALTLAASCGLTKMERVGNITTGGAGADGDESGFGGESGEGGEASESGGAAGARSGGDAGAGRGGTPSVGGQPAEFNCEACEELAAGTEITAIVATDSAVLWTEHGTQDELGNYRSDGRLLTLPVDADEPSVLLEGLPGPVQLALSPGYAYFLLDEASAGADYQLARAPRAGGSIEPLANLAIVSDSNVLTPHAEWLHTSFATGGGYAFWIDGEQLERLAEEEGSVVETVMQVPGARTVLADASVVYFDDAEGLWSVPLGGGPRALLGAFTDDASDYSAFVLSGEHVYGVERSFNNVDAEQFYVARLPKTGGEWQRVATLVDQTFRLVLSGEHVVSDSPKRSGRRMGRRLMQGNLASADASVEVARAPFGPTGERVWRAWSASNAGVFLESDDKLYRVPFAP